MNNERLQIDVRYEENGSCRDLLSTKVYIRELIKSLPPTPAYLFLNT